MDAPEIIDIGQVGEVESINTDVVDMLDKARAVLAGKGGGLLPRPGRQVQCAANTPLSNLWLTLAQLTGLERREFGVSTGALSKPCTRPGLTL